MGFGLMKENTHYCPNELRGATRKSSPQRVDRISTRAWTREMNKQVARPGRGREGNLAGRPVPPDPPGLAARESHRISRKMSQFLAAIKFKNM